MFSLFRRRPEVVSFKRLTPTAYVPTYATDGAAAMDLYSDVNVTIPPCNWAMIGTGVAVELPRRVVGLICSRSGLAAKQGVFVLNAPGVIDPDYRGPLGVVLANFSLDKELVVGRGDRIAQFMMTPFIRPEVREAVGELSTTARGAGGFGSTGVTANVVPIAAYQAPEAEASMMARVRKEADGNIRGLIDAQHGHAFAW